MRILRVDPGVVATKPHLDSLVFPDFLIHVIGLINPLKTTLTLDLRRPGGAGEEQGVCIAFQ